MAYFQFSDMTAPANPGAGLGRLYKKTGNDGLFWKPDGAGAEVDLTANGVTSLAEGSATGNPLTGEPTGAITINNHNEAWNASQIRSTNVNISGLADGHLLCYDPSQTRFENKSLIGGTAIGVSASNGNVTINNQGVTSLTAGTGISLSGSTGAVTVSGLPRARSSVRTTDLAVPNSIGIATFSTITSLTLPETGDYLVFFSGYVRYIDVGSNEMTVQLRNNGSTFAGIDFQPSTTGASQRWTPISIHGFISDTSGTTISVETGARAGGTSYTFVGATSSPVDSSSYTKGLRLSVLRVDEF